MTLSTDLFLEYKRRPGRAALARLLERAQDTVYTVCYQVLRHPQDAEDACQEVLLETSRQVDSVEEPEKFSSWLYRTALHTALDLKRKRGRQRVRDAGARPVSVAGTEAAEALHLGLAGLDDPTRTLVVEHYFARRPLRELAAERGCSEVAVWKRLQNAKERLKKSLGSAAVSALEGIANIPAPAGVLQKALGFSGGLAMKMGIKAAIVVPLLLLLAGAGTMLLARRSNPPPPPPRAEARRPAVARPTTAAPSTRPPAAAPAASGSGQRSEPRPRKPYPLKDPSSGHSAAAVRTWEVLRTKRVTIDLQNESLMAILKTVGDLTGLTMMAAPGLGEHQITMKCADIAAAGCLSLLLKPRMLNYEILPDGTLYIDVQEKIKGGYEREAGRVDARLGELARVREEMDRGWDGLSKSNPQAELETLLRNNMVVATQGETSLENEIRRLKDLGVHVHVESLGVAPADHLRHQEMMRKPFLQLVAERSIDDHLRDLARAYGLVSVPFHSMVLFTTEKNAALYRAQADETRRESERILKNLQKPVEPASDIQEFLEAIPRSHGFEIVPAEEVWNGTATLSLPAGTTLRQALDQLKAQGCRWALRDGKLYVLK